MVSIRLTRRHLMLAGAATTLAAMLEGPAARALRGAGRAMAHPESLRRSTYAPLIGERFAVSGRGRGAVSMRLVEIRDITRRSQRGRVMASGEDAFALYFAGGRSARLEGGMYRLRHPAVGTVALVLIPVGRGRRGQRYEAVINRVHRTRA